ncbi:MAG TPA: SDR family oxidoreductase [Polyangiales bacterium]
MNETKTVLISGASTGIGEATSLALAERGFRVIAGVRQRRDGERLERSAKGSLTAVRLDITDADSIASVRSLLEPLVGESGLWGLFNNAGTSVSGPLEFTTLERIRFQFETNVFGQIALTQAMLPMLRKARGRIVNNTSMTGKVAIPMSAPYAASKHALEAISDALRIEVAHQGIQVSVIEAGAIATPIWSKGLDQFWDEFKALGPTAHTLYQRLFEQVHYSGRFHALHAVDASHAVDAVYHALTAPRPRTRYVVGPDARLLLAMKWLLPDRWMDRAFHTMSKHQASRYKRLHPSPANDNDNANLRAASAPVVTALTGDRPRRAQNS